MRYTGSNRPEFTAWLMKYNQDFTEQGQFGIIVRTSRTMGFTVMVGDWVIIRDFGPTMRTDEEFHQEFTDNVDDM